MSTASDDHLIDQIRGEFLDEARDIVSEIDVMLGNLRSHSGDATAALEQMRRHFHNLRIGGRSVNLPAIDLIVHRADDYIAGISKISEREIEDIQTFNDRLRATLDGGVPNEPEGLRRLVRELPSRSTFNVEDVVKLDIEVMLVSPQRTTAHFVERELQACGYRVVNVATSFEAIEQAVRARPEMIICSALLDELSGIDLACAFNAMPTTATIPFALLTSFSWGHPSLEGLPTRAAIIRKGAQFGDDLAEALARFAIT